MQAYESPFIVLGRRLILTVTAVNAREDHVSVEDCRDYDGGKQRGHEAVFGKGGVDEGQYQGSQVEKADEDKAYGGGDPFFLHEMRIPFKITLKIIEGRRQQRREHDSHGSISSVFCCLFYVYFWIIFWITLWVILYVFCQRFPLFIQLV